MFVSSSCCAQSSLARQRAIEASVNVPRRHRRNAERQDARERLSSHGARGSRPDSESVDLRRAQSEHIASSKIIIASPPLIWGQRSVFAAPRFDSAIVIAGTMHLGETIMVKSAALLTLAVLTASNSAIARPYHGHRHVARTVHHAKTVHHANASSTRDSQSTRVSHAGITCEMVRAYVAQVGLAQAAAMAQSAGITPAEKDRAKRCLAEKS